MQIAIGVARIFSGGCTSPKNLMTFFSHDLLYHGHMHYALYIATTYLFISPVGVHLAKFIPFLPHFNKNCLENFFSVALGVHLHPLP